MTLRVKLPRVRLLSWIVLPVFALFWLTLMVASAATVTLLLRAMVLLLAEPFWSRLSWPPLRVMAFGVAVAPPAWTLPRNSRVPAAAPIVLPLFELALLTSPPLRL